MFSVSTAMAGEVAILRNTCESEFKVEGSYFWKATFLSCISFDLVEMCRKQINGPCS